jgi:hypothetical protein
MAGQKQRKGPPPGAIKVTGKRRKSPPKVAGPRRKLSWFISGIVGILFFIISAIIVEARMKSFWGEPLLQKFLTVAIIHLHGLPKDPEIRARIVTVIPNLNLLPAEAVLPKQYAERFDRLGIRMGYVTDDVRPGGSPRYLCKAADIDLIPRYAQNIATALERFPDDALLGLKFQYLVFCGELYRDSDLVGGFPVPPDNTVMISLTHRSEEGLRALFFHEFYHLCEARWGLTNDPQWMKQFGIGYRNSYAGMMRPENNEMGTGTWGFMNLYSESLPLEDRAEIFSALMASPDRLFVFIQDQQDEMLAAKVNYIAGNAKKYLHIQLDATPAAR